MTWMDSIRMALLVVAMSLTGCGSFSTNPPAAMPESVPAVKSLSPAADVRIEYPFDDADWKESFEAITRHLVAIDETLISPEPFLGRKPFVVRRSTDGMPRATIGEQEYIVRVCPETRWYAQFAYQLGHELGHYWIGPYSTSQFQESVCTALSLAAMDELAKQWEDPPPRLSRLYGRETCAITMTGYRSSCNLTSWDSRTWMRPWSGRARMDQDCSNLGTVTRNT